MFEICRLLRAPKKARKPRKPGRKSIRIGARVMVGTKVYIVAARDTKYASAWCLDDLEGVRMPFSVSRDMIEVL